MLACGTHFFFDNVVSIEPKDDMCRLQRPKVLSELAMCVNVPKIALMIHPGSTLTSDDYLPAALPTKEELSTRLQVASLVGRRWGAAHRDRRRRLVK